jgi:hypothetical protein
MPITDEAKFHREMYKRGERIQKTSDELSLWADQHADQLDLRAPLQRYITGTIDRLDKLANKLKEVY